MKCIKPTVLVVCGPTTTGKSDLAVFLAQKLNGEIISADSRQVYTGMDLGSGKITRTEMKGVPHYLLDIANPARTIYTVEQFRKDGNIAIQKILSHNKIPIICGGTGFYIDTLVHNTEFPKVPPNKKLRAQLQKWTLEKLQKKLLKLDPKRAKTIDMKNKVRLIRALEVIETLGSVPKIKKHTKYKIIWIGLNSPLEVLRERIRARIHARIKKGMIREISNLHKKGVSWKRLESFGLEYRHIALFAQKKTKRTEMLTALENDIVNFAKRQNTWFGKNKEIAWFEVGKKTSKKEKGATMLQRQILKHVLKSRV